MLSINFANANCPFAQRHLNLCNSYGDVKANMFSSLENATEANIINNIYVYMYMHFELVRILKMQ